jgi:hypothetical protein
MADNNRFEENKGPQQGNTSGRKDLGEQPEKQKGQLHNVISNENMEDDIRPADARDTRDADTKIGLINDPDAGNRTAPGEPRTGEQPTQPMKDKGDMGKQGSMREQLKSKEGYRSMDEDENAKDSLKKGDNSNETMGNP